MKNANAIVPLQAILNHTAMGFYQKALETDNSIYSAAAKNLERIRDDAENVPQALWDRAGEAVPMLMYKTMFYLIAGISPEHTNVSASELLEQYIERLESLIKLTDPN